MAVPRGHHRVVAVVMTLTTRVNLVLRGLTIVTHPAPVAVVGQRHYREETALRLEKMIESHKSQIKSCENMKIHILTFRS